MMGETERVSERENMMSHVRLAQTLQAGYVNTSRSVASWTRQTPRLSNPSACCCATLFSLSSHGFSHARSLPPSFPHSPSYSLSLRGANGLCRAGLHETAAPLSGREEHSKKAKPCGERALQNKQTHTDAELRKLSLFSWRYGTNLMVRVQVMSDSSYLRVERIWMSINQLSFQLRLSLWCCYVMNEWLKPEDLSDERWG